MSALKMHADEQETSITLVRKLISAQFPRWARLAITPGKSAGTDNAIYRLGRELSVRLPRIGWATGQIEKERRWLPALANHLPFAIPAQVEIGEPGEGYPWNWAVYRWIPGENRSIDNLPNPDETARDLARFLRALQQINPSGGPLAEEHGLRGVPLAKRDSRTRDALRALHGIIDTRTAELAWESALAAPDWAREPVFFHGDFLPGNILFKRARVCAVIDFSGLGVGDPACDLMAAWSLLPAQNREVFRAALGVNDAAWARGRGQALSQALIFIPYYLHTNPAGVKQALRVVREVADDYRVNG